MWFFVYLFSFNILLSKMKREIWFHGNLQVTQDIFWTPTMSFWGTLLTRALLLLILRFRVSFSGAWFICCLTLAHETTYFISIFILPFPLLENSQLLSASIVLPKISGRTIKRVYIPALLWILCVIYSLSTVAIGGNILEGTP